MSDTQLSPTVNPLAKVPGGTRSVFRSFFSSLRRVALFYLVALTLAETLTTLIEPRVGLALHGLILISLLLYASLGAQGPHAPFPALPGISPYDPPAQPVAALTLVPIYLLVPGGGAAALPGCYRRGTHQPDEQGHAGAQLPPPTHPAPGCDHRFRPGLPGIPDPAPRSPGAQFELAADPGASLDPAGLHRLPGRADLPRHDAVLRAAQPRALWPVVRGRGVYRAAPGLPFGDGHAFRFWSGGILRLGYPTHWLDPGGDPGARAD